MTPADPPLDDAAIDALLAGTAGGGSGEGLASFIEELRAAVGPLPTPSPALAAAIAAGGIAVFQPRFARLRMLRTRFQGLVNGLGAAGKVALGVGVAGAAIAGAAELGLLPGPVQHAVSTAIGAVTPFSPPDPGPHAPGGGNVAGGDTSSTSTTTTVVAGTTTVPVERSHDGNGAVVTPTTSGAHLGDGGGSTTTVPGGDGSGDNGSTPTTVPGNDGSGGTPTTVPGNDGSGGTTTTVPGNDGSGGTTTTVPGGDGSGGTVKFLSIHCERSSSPVSITCTWSASGSPDHAHYVLWRTGDGNGRQVLETENALTFTDTSVVPGTEYGYRVSSLRADGSVDAHSALFRVECCGTTPTITYPGFTTTTTTTVHGGHGKHKP